MDRIDEIHARVQATTPGPWIAAEMTSHKSRKGGRKYYKVVEKAHTLEQICHYVQTAKMAEFIAHSREDIPWLLDENERLTRGIKDIGKICAERYDEIVRLTAKVEALEAAIKRNRPCWACCRNCDTFDRHECIESGGRFFRFNEASFVGEVSHEH